MTTPAVVAAFAVSRHANAQTLYWDMDPAAAGATSGSTAPGIWDNGTSANWNTDSAGGITPGNVVWSAGNTAVFSAGTDATGTSQVTISGTISGVNGITFEEGTVNMTGAGTLTLTGATLNQISANSTIAGIIAGSVGINKTGTGIHSLTNTANVFTGGVTISQGILSVTNDGALGNAANNVTFTGTGGSLRASANFSSSRSISLNATNNTIEVLGAAVGLTWAGTISGANGLNKNGAGTLLLTGSNSHTTTTVSAGTLIADNTASLPGYNSGGNTNVVAGTLAVSAGGVGQWNSGQIDDFINNATVAAGATLGINVDTANSFTYGSNISAAANYAKLGGGTLTLTGNNTYTGTTTVVAGTLEFNGTGMGNLTITNGAFGTGTGTLASGTGAARLTVAGGGTFSPAGVGTIGTFTADEATFNQLSILNFDVGAPGTSDRINVTDIGTSVGLALPTYSTNNSLDTININNVGGLAAGTYSLIGYHTSLSGSVNSLHVAGLPSNLDAEMVLAGSGATATIDMVVRAAGAGTAAWAVDSSGSYADPANWSGVSQVPTGQNTALTFGNVLSANRNVTVTGSGKTIGSLTFDSPFSYIVDGMVPFTLDVSSGNAVINNINGSHTFNPRINVDETLDVTVANASDTLSLGGLIGSSPVNKLGPGSLLIKRIPDYTGNINNSAGTVDINLTANQTMTATMSGTGTWRRSGGNTLTINSDNSAFSGPVVLAGGTTSIANSNRLGDGSATNSITVASNSTLTLSAATDFPATRGITLSAGTLTLNNAGNTTIPGVISGSGAFTKTGAGILTLSGANTYTGTTTISQGQVIIGADNNIGTGALTMNPTGTFSGQLTTTAAFNMGRNLNLSTGTGMNTLMLGGNMTLSGVISGSGNFTIDASNGAVTTVTLTGNNTKTGPWRIGVFNTSSSANLTRVIPQHDMAFGPGGPGNEIDFEQYGTTNGTYSRIELQGGRNINKDIITRGSGNANGGYGQIYSTAGVNTWSGNIHIGSTGSNSDAMGSGFGAAIGSTLVITGQINELTGIRAPIYGVVNPGTNPGIGTIVLWPQGGGHSGNLNSTFVRHFDGTLELWGNGALGDFVNDGSANPSGNAFDAEVLVAGFGGDNPVIGFRAPPGSDGFYYSDRKQLRLYSQAAGGASATLANFGGDNTFAGTIVMRSTASSRNLDMRAGSLELQSPLYFDVDGAAYEVNKLGPGELILSGVNNGTDGLVGNEFSGLNQEGITAGTFNINDGTLTLRGAGELNGGMAVVMAPKTTLKIDNTSQAKNNRLITNVSRSMNAGGVHLLGNASASTSQTLGDLGLVGSMSEITVNQPGAGATTTLTLSGALTRTNTATLRPTAMLFGLQNTNSVMNVGNLSVTAPQDHPNSTLRGGAGGAGTSTMAIVPWLANSALDGSSADFVTANDGAGGAGRVRALAANEYAPLASGNSTLNNTTASGTVNISADTTVNSIKFNDASNVSIAAGQTLYVNSGAILGAGASGTISGPGTLAFHQYYPPGGQGVPGALDENTFEGITDGVDPASAAEAVVHVPAGKTLLQASNNVITGAQGLTKSGDGTLRLEGNNTFGYSKAFWYTDGVDVDPRNELVRALTINAGEVVFTADSALGHTSSAGVVLDGGTIRGTNGADAARPINLVSTTLNGVGALAGATATYSGVISGEGLHVVGPGTVRLTNDSNTYTGGTTVMAGYLQLLETDPAQTPMQGTITIDGGFLRADENLSLQRSATLAASNETGGLYVAAGKTLTYGGAGVISGAGRMNIEGGGTVVMGSQSAQNTYTGSTYINNGTLEYTGVNGLPAFPSGVVPDYWVLSNNSTLRFNVTSSTGSDFSSGRRGITISSTGGIIDIPGSNIVANFGGIYGSGTLTKQGTGEYRLRSNNSGFSGKWDIQEGLLEMGVASNNALTLGVGTGADFVTIRDGATLRQTTTASTGTMGAAQGVTLAGTNHTIAVANNTILTIPGDITAGAGKNLTKTEAGTLRIKNFRGQNLNVNAGTLGIIANGGNDGASKLAQVNIDPAAKIDLTNNKMVLTSMAGGNGGAGAWNGSAYDGVSKLVVDGQGTKVGGVPQWDGAGGIMTSTASKTNLVTTLAVARAGDIGKTSHGGQSVAADDTLVMYTYGGDANLSGKVDADDYFRIDSHYGQTGNASIKFVNGDFNYDGVINGDDYAVIDAGYVGQGAPIAAGMGVGESFAAIAGGEGGALDGVTAVPEPGSFALISLAALSCLGRRRRK